MKCTLSLWSDAGYGWRPTNGHDTIKTSYSKKSVSVFGVLGLDSIHIRTVDACNSETFKGFLREMLRIYPKILLILDNAPYHKSETVTEFVKANEDRLRLVFLARLHPAAQPDRAAVERPQEDARGQVFCVGRRSEGDPSRPSPATARCAPSR